MDCSTLFSVNIIQTSVPHYYAQKQNSWTAMLTHFIMIHNSIPSQCAEKLKGYELRWEQCHGSGGLITGLPPSRHGVVDKVKLGLDYLLALGFWFSLSVSFN
jgi:hypothetical protein